MPEKKVKGLTMTVTFNQDDVLEMMKKLVEQRKLAPVVHAHWFLLDECSNAGVYCSNCHKKCFTERAWYGNVKQKSRYCPNCGAKMDEVEERENF